MRGLIVAKERLNFEFKNVSLKFKKVGRPVPQVFRFVEFSYRINSSEKEDEFHIS